MKQAITLLLVIWFSVAAKQGLSQSWNLTGNAGTSALTDFVGTTDAQSLVFRTNATEAMRITSGKLIGIGSNNPSYKVQISNSVNARSLHLDNTFNTNSTKYGVYNTVNNVGTGGRYGIYNSSTSHVESAATNYGIYNTVSHPGSGIAYGVYSFVSTSGSGTHYGIYSSSTGSSNYSFYGLGRGYFSDKVGIGITNPVGSLHVENNEVDLTSGGSLILGLVTGVNMAFDANEIHVRDNGEASTLFLNPLGGTVVINNSGVVDDVTLSSDGSFRIGDNAAKNLVFDANEMQARDNGAASGLFLNMEGGNVGIGTSFAPEKLSVCGTVKATEIRVESGWCDYVFANDYQLRSLGEVAQFIKDHKHLPNIPPASEVEREGLKLGEMSRRMMEKIEELTLYLLQQDEQISSLKADNAKMQAQIQSMMSR